MVFHGQGDHVIVAQALHVRSVHQVVEGFAVWGEGGMKVLQRWFFMWRGDAEVESARRFARRLRPFGHQHVFVCRLQVCVERCPIVAQALHVR